MQTAINPFGNVFQPQFNASRRVGEAVFSGIEKMDMVFLNAMQRMLVNNFNFLGGMNRPPESGELFQLSGFPARMPQEFLSYQKEFVEIFVTMQREFAGLLQEYVEQIRSGMAFPGTVAASLPEAPAQRSATTATMVDNMTRSNPIGGMLSFWEYTLRELTSFAQKNLTSMQTSMENATQQGAVQAMDVFRNTAGNIARNAADAFSIAGNASGAKTFAHKKTDGLAKGAGKDHSSTGKRR